MIRDARSSLAWGIVAAALLAAMRLPHDDATAGMAAAGFSLALVAAAIVGAVRPASGWVPLVGLGAGTGLLLTPDSRASPLDWVPAPVAILPFLMFLHFAYAAELSHAPRLAYGSVRGRLESLMHHLPPLVLWAVVAFLPTVLRRVLPERIGSTLELGGAAGALVFGLLIVGTLLGVASARRLLTRDPGRPRASAPQPTRAAEPTPGATRP